MHKHHKDIFRNLLRNVPRKQPSRNVNHQEFTPEIIKGTWKKKIRRWVISEGGKLTTSYMKIQDTIIHEKS